MVSAAERVHVANAPPELGERYFHCLVCGRSFSKRSAWRHFTGATTHGLEKDIVKHWVVVKDSHHLGNKTPTRMQLGVLLDADRPRSTRPNDDDVEVMDEVVVMDDVPDIIPDTAVAVDTPHRPLQRAGGARLRRGDEGLCQALPHTEVLDNGIRFDTGTRGADTATQARQAVVASLVFTIGLPVTWPRREPQ